MLTMCSWSVFRRLSRGSGGSPDILSPSTVDPQNEKLASIPNTQIVLLLHGPKEPYRLSQNYPVPMLKDEREILIKVSVIGLNPIDWKAPDFNFGIPELPCISGREYSGTIAKTSQRPSRWGIGDRVIAISTDYRDLRKAAYQEYAVALDYNVVKIPPGISFEDGATLGVAFVAAALGLGICMGIDFSGVLNGPDLLRIVRKLGPDALSADIVRECLHSTEPHERARKGDWIVIWGASSTSANLAMQLARLAGLRVVAVVDKARHGMRLTNHDVLKPDFLVDIHSPERAIDIIHANFGGQLRFGLDTRGRESAAYLLRALSFSPAHDLCLGMGDSIPSPPPTPKTSSMLRAHLVGLTGLPKETRSEGVLLHTVPIKLFHEAPAVGQALVRWLERLLENGLVRAPEIVGLEEGLENINQGLDRMRRGEIRGGKLVVRV